MDLLHVAGPASRKGHADQEDEETENTSVYKKTANALQVYYRTDTIVYLVPCSTRNYDDVTSPDPTTAGALYYAYQYRT